MNGLEVMPTDSEQVLDRTVNCDKTLSLCPGAGTFALTALVHEGADGRAQLDYFHMGLLHGPPKGRCPDVQEENSEASR